MSCADVAGRIDKIEARVAKLEGTRSALAETGSAIQRLRAANEKNAELQREANVLRGHRNQALADLAAAKKAMAEQMASDGELLAHMRDERDRANEALARANGDKLRLAADKVALRRERDEAQVAVTNLSGDWVQMEARLKHLQRAIEDQRVALTQERDEARAVANELGDRLKKRLRIAGLMS